jgi:hypothetical protein
MSKEKHSVLFQWLPPHESGTGLIAFCVKHLLFIIEKLKPVGTPAGNRPVVNAGRTTLPAYSPDDPYGARVLGRVECPWCRALAISPARADVLIPTTAKLDKHPLTRPAEEVLFVGLCFSHVRKKLNAKRH